MKKTLKYVGLIIVLTLIGFLIRDYFFNISFSQLNNGNIQIVSRMSNGQFYSHLLFSLFIGAIPMLYLIVEKITKLKFLNQGLITFVLIVGSGILFWQFRIFQLKGQLQKLSEFNIGDGIKNQINTKDLNFGAYLFIGFVIGAILSTLVFRRKNKTVVE